MSESSETTVSPPLQTHTNTLLLGCAGVDEIFIDYILKFNFYADRMVKIIAIHKPFVEILLHYLTVLKS